MSYSWIALLVISFVAIAFILIDAFLDRKTK
jgi:hypothetical protein